MKNDKIDTRKTQKTVTGQPKAHMDVDKENTNDKAGFPEGIAFKKMMGCGG